MNDENLRPLGDGSRTKSREREIQSLGGIKSGEARRRRRDARERMLEVLASVPKLDKRTLDNLKQLGVKGSGNGKKSYDLETLAIAAIVQKAMRGDVNAYRAVLETIGEDAKTKALRDGLPYQDDDEGLTIVYDYGDEAEAEKDDQ